MTLSVAFIIIDILAVTHVIEGSKDGLPNGINPFWKLAFVFKCLTDTIVLDDFKTALDRLKAYKMEQIGGTISQGSQSDFVNTAQARAKKFESPNSGEMRNAEHFETTPRDWSKNVDYDNLDLEAALRMDSTQFADNSK